MSNDLFKKPLLIFSEYCSYSHNFLQILVKHPVLYNSFIRMNIDINPITKKRPLIFHTIQQVLNKKITKVPTIITPGAEYILSDEDAFKWLDFQINHLNKSKKVDLVAFNPNEMVSFSDNYADFDIQTGSTDINDAKEQSYKFYVNKELPSDNYLNTNKNLDPNKFEKGFLDDLEESTQNIDYNSLQSERQYFDDHQQKQESVMGNINFKDNNNSQGKINTQDFNSFSKNRQEPTVSRQSINFTDPSFGLAGKLNCGNNMSLKTKDLDNKLSLLQKDREMMDNTLNIQRKPF